jgi:hypothetical protein
MSLPGLWLGGRLTRPSGVNLLLLRPVFSMDLGTVGSTTKRIGAKVRIPMRHRVSWLTGAQY